MTYNEAVEKVCNDKGCAFSISQGLRDIFDQAAIEFTKHHVNEALEAVDKGINDAYYDGKWPAKYEIKQYYKLDNIKK